MLRRLLGFAVVGLGVALSPGAAIADGLEVRFGAYFPGGGPGSHPSSCGEVNPTSCNVFLDLDELFAATRKGWTGPVGGIELNRRFGRSLELALHVDGYGRTRLTSYRDYTWENGDEIEQDLSLSVVPIGVTLRLLPPVSRRSVAPYVAVGADIVVWTYSERGDLIDFSTEDLDILYDERSVSGATPGAHVAVGVRVPLGHDFAATAEARYLLAKKQRMDRPFDVYEIDVSGASATFGLLLRF